MDILPTYEELMRGKTRFVYSDDNYLYIRPIPKHKYDHNMYKVNRKTREVTGMSILEFGPEEKYPNIRLISGQNYLRL